MKTYQEINSKAWDSEVNNKNFWTLPVTKEELQKAKNGEINIYLTPGKFVKNEWVKDVKNKKILALACGGGQQAIIFAAANNEVTVLDNSEKQLLQDKKTAEHFNLDITIKKADMQDLSLFEDNTFDYIYNPTSTCFIEDVEKVYSECFRVLKEGGEFVTSATNPVLYLFDEKDVLRNKLKVKYTIPYSDIKSLSKKNLQKIIDSNDTLEFSHTCEKLIGGITKAGFAIIDFYTDNSNNELLDSFIHDCYFAIRCKKMVSIQ
ncbi:MAG: class I SAM-dependent methyltransferase [Pleomorphochaeta sp.]